MVKGKRKVSIESVSVNGNQGASEVEDDKVPAVASKAKETAKAESKSSEVTALSVRGNGGKESLGIQPYQPGALPQNRPVVSSAIQISRIIPGAEPRPVLASHMQLAESRPGLHNRPVFALSKKQVHMLPGLPNRPVVEAKVHVSEVHSISGHRPVVTEQIQESTTLMGYLD